MSTTSPTCPIFLMDIFRVVGRLAERPLRFRHLGPGIGEAALIPLSLSRRVSELTGISIYALSEAIYRLGEGQGLVGDLPISLVEEHGWRHVDLTHLGAQLHELDRDGTTARLWRELCRKWPIVRDCYHELFPGEATGTTPAIQSIDSQISLASPETPLTQLKALADKLTLSANETRIIAMICDGSGKVSLSELAIKLEWENPPDNWNSARKRLNKKFKKHGWKFTTNCQYAVAKEQPKAGRKQVENDRPQTAN